MNASHLKEIVVPKQKAVFWMDGQGRWHNQHGPFEHKGIIDFFNASIKKDKQGFHVAQIRDGVYEKVYFRYEDTPLFVIAVVLEKTVELTLNTGLKFILDPQELFLRGDQLYLRKGKERIKFSERALLKLSRIMQYDNPNYFIKVDGRSYPIPLEGE